MNRNDLVTTTVFGLLTDEFQTKKDLFEVCVEMGIKPIEVNRALNELKKKGGIAMIEKDGHAYVKIATSEEVTEKPVIKLAKSENKFGTTSQIGRDGKEFQYIRKEFDGEEGKLSPEHEAKKNDLIMFKSVLRKLVTNCNGIGDVAITMYEPDSKFANKDGKVFYRWDNPGRTEALIDQLHKVIEPMLKCIETEEE